MPAPRAELLAILALFLGGCLESKEEVRLSSDGRGTVRQTWTLDPAAHDVLLRSAAALFTGRSAPAALPPSDPLSPVWLRRGARMAKGYEIERVDSRTDGAKRVLEVSGRFDQLAAAARGGAFFTAGLSLERKDETWRLTCWDVWEPAARDEGMEVAGRPYADVVDALAAGLEGFALDRTFVVPTAVVETNGTLLEDGKTVHWRVAAADLKEARALRLHIVFTDAPELLLTPFRHRPDPDALVTRLLEPPPGTSSTSGPR